MKTTEEIIEMLVETQEQYACQDNAEAARITHVLSELIERAREPSIEELKTKFLGEISAIILKKDGREWDRARVANGNYDLDTAHRQIDEWKAKILREEPDAVVEIVVARGAVSDPNRD